MACLNLMLHFASVIALGLKVRGQHVYYITSAFTECFPVTTAADTLSADSSKATDPTTVTSEPNTVGSSNPIHPPLPPADSDGLDGWQPPAIVTYSMPPCAVCDCPTCTTTSIFTTMLPGLGPKGPMRRPYIVTETYVGMSSLPYFPTPTPIPYGFTTAVETCTDCGAQPITATKVVPKTGRPWDRDTGETTTTRNVGPVETPLITSKESGPKITQAGGQESGNGHIGASTWGPLAATPTYIHVSAAESSWSESLLSCGMVMSAFWVAVLFQ